LVEIKNYTQDARYSHKNSDRCFNLFITCNDVRPVWPMLNKMLGACCSSHGNARCVRLCFRAFYFWSNKTDSD